MQPPRFIRACVTVCGLLAPLGMAANTSADGHGPNIFGFANPTGIVRTYNVNGSIDFNNPCGRRVHHGKHGTSRFPGEMRPRVLGVSDRAGFVAILRGRWQRCGLPLFSTASAP
jgi:hypothetical protein